MKIVGDVAAERYLDENGRVVEWHAAGRSQADVVVAGLQAAERDDALPDDLSAVVQNAETQKRQIGTYHLRAR